MILTETAISGFLDVKDGVASMLVGSGVTTVVGGVYQVDQAIVSGRKYTTMMAVNAEGVENGLLAIALAVGVAGVAVPFKFYGVTDVFIEGAADVTLTSPNHLVKAVAAAVHLIIAGGADDRVVGYALAAQASATPTLTAVLFNGIGGFGNKA